MQTSPTLKDLISMWKQKADVIKGQLAITPPPVGQKRDYLEATQMTYEECAMSLDLWLIEQSGQVVPMDETGSNS